ncbi:MAG: DNA polymerase bacteriophage-type [Microgenomates bacterium 39_7]|nr:MAG: DNA polymerase bacteriophage-type [Microgenomates bacterium 39_7]
MSAKNKKKYDQLKQIRNELLQLSQSPLFEYRQKNNYKPVIGQGNHDADIMFVGEAPGKNEAETGVPFCGAAGRVLSELLESINLKREEVYITNILKDRPPNNRDPSPQEIELYSPFLIRQVEIIQPKVIATLGRFSMEFIMKEYGLESEVTKISLIHGKTFQAQAQFGQLQIVPLFHPAVALYNASQRKTLEEDFQVLSAIITLI